MKSGLVVERYAKGITLETSKVLNSYFGMRLLFTDNTTKKGVLSFYNGSLTYINQIRDPHCMRNYGKEVMESHSRYFVRRPITF